MSTPAQVPGERMPPLYFAGRDAELRKFDADLQRLCSTGEGNGLQLTTGVPGSGKTRLAGEFAKRVNGKVASGRTVSTLMISSDELNDPLSLFMAMGRAIGDEQKASKIAQVDDRVSNVSGGVVGTSVAVAKDVGRRTSAFGGLLRESVEKGMWKNKTLVLLVDELQAIDDEAMSALRVLHQGLTRCPVLLMGFGLQHTAMRLANPTGGRGISRIAPQTVLEPLPPDATLVAFAENLSMVGHDGIPDESLDALAKASHGFPQHINGYLEGAHAALTQYGHLTGESLQHALRYGHERRVMYYEDRLTNGDSHGPMLAVVDAMERVGETALTRRQACDALAQGGYGDDDLDSAIAHGALVYVRGCVRGKMSFGIPSFRSYMQRVLAREQSRERSENAPDTGR